MKDREKAREILDNFYLGDGTGVIEYVDMALKLARMMPSALDYIEKLEGSQKEVDEVLGTDE